MSWSGQTWGETELKKRPQHFQRLETSTSLIADEVVPFESVKRHLRQLGADDDSTIRDAILDAVNQVEMLTRRTIRQSVSSTAFYSCWAYQFVLPHPPAVSVTSVKYYDPDDTLQTVTASDYTLNASTLTLGVVEFQTDFSFANLNSDRSDPVQIAYVRGYASADEVPPSIKAAVRLIAESTFDGQQAKYAEARERLQPFIHRGLP